MKYQLVVATENYRAVYLGRYSSEIVVSIVTLLLKALIGRSASVYYYKMGGLNVR